MPPNPFARDPAVTVGVGADTDEFNEQIDGAVDSLGKMRTAVGLTGAALGALATGALAKSVSAAADFQSAMVEVEKVTSPETAEAMGSSIREMAEEIPLAQREIAGLAADAGRFGIEGPKAIESFTRSVAKMAEATNLGTEQAGESLARLAELTNTPVSEIENLGSSINSLSNNFATSSQEIVDSMLRSSASLSQIGLNQREIAGLSASLNEVSESSERAGTRLRRLGQELVDPKKVGELASALGMTRSEFVQMRDDSPVALIRRLATTMKEGGSEANALRKSLSTTSRQALAGLGQNLDGVSQAQDLANKSFREGTSLQREFEAATDTFNAKLTLFKNQLTNVGIQIGQQLLPPLTDLLEDASAAVDAFSEWNAQTDGLAGTLGLATTAVGGLAVAAGAFVGGPAALVVGALGGMATAAGVLGVEFEGLQDVAGETFGTIQDAGGDALQEANDLWDEHGDTVTAIAEETYEVAESAIGDATAGVESLVRRNWGKIERTVSTSVSEMERTLGTVDQTLDAQLVAPLQDSESQTRKTFDSMATEASQSFGMIETATSELFGAYVSEYIRPTVKNAGRLWRQHLSGPDGIVTNARTAFNSLWNNIIKPTLDAIQGAWDLFGDDLIKIARGLFGTLESVVEIGMDSVLTLVNVVLDLISGDWEGAWNNATAFVKRTLDELASWFEDDAADMFGGAAGIVADAIAASFNAVVPDELVIPEVSIGGQSIDLPSAEIAGEEIGGGSLSVPSMTVGGDVFDLPQLAEGGLIEQSGLAFVDEGELFSGVPGAEVDRSPGMMLSQRELRDAVAEGVARAARSEDLFRTEQIVRAVKQYAGGETTVEFRDQDRYRAARR
jgi:TP901 family phage tail tape measure protein